MTAPRLKAAEVKRVAVLALLRLCAYVLAFALLIVSVGSAGGR